MATLTLEPNGAGDETAIPNLVGAATHWQAVLTDDGDTSYVEVPEDDEDWHRDLYAMEDSSDLGTISSVTVYAIGRIGQPLDWLSSSCIELSLKTHDTVYEETKSLPSNAYGAVFNAWATNPNTGEAWTWAEINALQAGMNLHRSHTFDPPAPRWARVTQVYVVVTYTPAPVVAPTVTTDPATGIEAAAATDNGNITDNGGEDCDKRGFVYNTSPHGDPEDIAPADSEYANYVEETDSFGTGAFTGALTSLEPKTTYYVRAYAHNSAGYSYGNEVEFTTLVAIPSVTTQEMTDVEPTTATGNGNVTDLGGESLSQHGHCWSTSHDPTTSDDKTELGAKSETGAFTSSLTGLSPNTVYYCRTYATNSAGTSYGSEVSFTTPVALPAVTTEAASAIGLNGATLNGALTSDGGEPCYCGFEWGETIAYGTTTPTQRKVTGEVFSQTILSLGEAAQYHFRAFATNSSGTAYGEDRTIDTLFRTNKAYALARYEV